MARYNVDLQDNEGNAYQIMANPDSVAEFSPAANRENIRSGETYRVIFGKIMKYLSEVGNAAYVGLANNCTTTIAGFALDARQGKELMDRINELNRDFVNFQSSFRDGCSAIAAAIVDMGVPTADNASPDELAANIRKIKHFSVIKKGKIQGAKHTWDISDITGYKTFELYQNIFPVVDGGIHTANNYSKSISFSYDHTKGIVSSIGSLGEGYDHVGITLYVVF